MAPICLRDGEAGFLPITAYDQAEAVKLCRAFEDDPATSWTDPPTAVEAWRQTYNAGQ